MQDPIYTMFGDRVRARREEKKFTQEELARRVDLSRTSITNIEKGRHRVLLHQVVEIAEALDTSAADLFPGIAPPGKSKPLRDDVARLIETLKQEAKPT
jgi:transcriptional regulator with XRE-family HTH domain